MADHELTVTLTARDQITAVAQQSAASIAAIGAAGAPVENAFAGMASAADAAGSSMAGAGAAGGAGVRAIGSGADDAGASVGTLGDTISSFGDQATAAINDPIGAVENLASSLGGDLLEAVAGLGGAGEVAAGGLAILGGGIAAVAGVVFALADKTAEAGEEVEAFSLKTGIAVQNIGPLQFAVTAAGGSLDTLSTIFRTISMKEATDQGGKFSAALADMGINAGAFKNADMETQLLMLAQAEQSGAAGGNLMNDMLAIGGRQLVNQIPLIDKLNAGLLKTGAALGVTWTDDQLAQSKAFTLSLGTMETAVEDIAIKIGQAVLPAMSALMTSMATSPGFINGVIGATNALGHGLGYVVESATDVVGVVGVLGSSFIGLNSKFLSSQIAVAQWVVDILSDISKIPGAAAPLSGVIDTMTAGIVRNKAALDASDATYNSTKNAFTSIFQAGRSVSTALEGMNVSAGDATGANLSLNKSLTDGGAAGAAMQKAIDGVVASLEGDSNKTKEEVAALQQVVGAQNLDTEAKARAVDMIETLIQAGVPLSAQIMAFEDANVGLGKSYAELQKAEEAYVDASTKASTEWVNKWLDAQQKMVAGAVSAWEKAYDDQIKADAKEIDSFGQVYAANIKSIQTASTELFTLQQKQNTDLYQQQVSAINAWAAQQLAAFNAEQAKSGETSEVLQAQATAYGAILQAEVIAKIQAIGPAWANEFAQMAGTAATDLSGIASDFSALAGSSTGALKAIADGFSDAATAAKGIQTGLKDFASGDIVGGITAVAGAVIGLGEDLWNAVFGLNDTQQALQNLGVTVKNQMFGDPWFASQTEELKELQGQATLTAPTLNDLFNGIEQGGQQATEAMSTLTTLLPSIEKNASLATSTSAELLSTIKGGGAEASAAMTNLNTMVTDFQSQAATTSGVWSPAFQSLISQSEQAGQNIASITTALQTQITSAQTGITTALGITSAAYTAAAADQATLADPSSTTAAITTATADLVTQQGIIQATQITTQGQASAVASSIVGIVDANMKAGQSFVQAFTGAEPAIQGLQAQLQATGLSGGQAFDFLNQEVTIATGKISGPALTATEGYTQAVVSLANAGELTQGQFAGLEDSIASTDATLQAQGASGQASLASLQPDLQAAWQLEQQFGYTADSATQSLIDQGVQAGIVGEKQESSTQQMVDALNGVKTDLDDIVQKMGGLGSAAQNAAGQINSAFGSIQSPSVDLQVQAQVNNQSLANAGASATQTTGIDESTATAMNLPIGDSPVMAVGSPGLVYVKPGDVFGMPALTAGWGATATPYAGAAPAGTAAAGGVTVQMNFYNSFAGGGSDADGEAFADAFIYKVTYNIDTIGTRLKAALGV